MSVRRKPEPRFQAQAFYISRKLIHSAGKTLVDHSPVPVVAPAVSLSLPAVVYLNILCSISFQIVRNPFRVPLDFFFIYFLIVIIPRAPAGRRKRKHGFVDRFVKFYSKRITVIVLDYASVVKNYFVFRRIEHSVGKRRLHISECHHEQVFVCAFVDPARNEMGPNPIGSFNPLLGLARASAIQTKRKDPDDHRKAKHTVPEVV